MPLLTELDSSVWGFFDVDDNLIKNSRTMPCFGSVAAAVDDKGTTCGWLTPKQAEFMRMFGGRVNVVLTTARSSKGVLQLNLPLPAGYAITSFGGVIRMPDRSSEPRFHALMADHSSQCKGNLATLLELVLDVCSTRAIDARSRIVSDDGLDLFLSIKHNQRNLGELAQLETALAANVPDGWRLHFNGNFLAAMPAYLGKRLAVEWFIANILKPAVPDLVTIGMGDSLSDLSFMGVCDYAFMPTDSQNFSSLTSEVKDGKL